MRTDHLKLNVVLMRYDMGGSYSIAHTPIPKRVPFTLGPWTGTANVASRNELIFGPLGMSLEFDLELVPEEEISLVEALEAFFGAEILMKNPSTQGDTNV